MPYSDYLDWHSGYYGRKPKLYILRAYYPNEFREEDAEQEEEKLKQFMPTHVEMRFGSEMEG